MTKFEEADEALQERWIRNLLGAAGAERFHNKQTYRPAPKQVPVLVLKPTFTSYAYEAEEHGQPIGIRYRINKIEGDDSTIYKDMNSKRLIDREVDALRDQGFVVRSIEFKALESPPTEAPALVSQTPKRRDKLGRKAMLARIGGLH